MTATDLFPQPGAVKGDADFARDGTLRTRIRRWWVPAPKRWVAWLMLNPSKAGAARNDPTALRVTHFSRAWGFDGWIGVNMIPYIASKPAEMWRWFDWERNGPDWIARDDLAVNLSNIEKAARAASLRVVAFGAEPMARCQHWVNECLEQFCQPIDNPGDGDGELRCLGLTKAGAPIHPMARGRHRVPDDAKPVLWEWA